MQEIDLFELLKIFILSVVQGITEWLPISSTGHLILVEEFIKLNLDPAFIEMFRTVVQLGSILAVVVLYFNKLNPFNPKKSPENRKETWVLWFKVAVASLPAIIFGFLINDYMEEYFNIPPVVAAALIIYGFAFIWIENRKPGRHDRQIENLERISYPTAFKTGLFQALSLIPGTSRSGSTILGGLLLGMERTVATEFSFFMSLPVMFGASFLKLLDFGFDFTSTELIYLVFGMFVAFIVSLIVIRSLLKFIKTNDFKPFGYYRIILGSIVILYYLFK
ncbi:undecaprenyl-diphosphate phosphatase [Facklamia sp. DSM 111018]|uniref:Undecaprenyl-diphosphatase n=1 Tax=Facklamia lactis TaxID=2749967 RepID=A0ABS0LPS2_9LACT|nr:undecaprenyl-diphosphate phosphatase [Facklamia lactis]MBG9980180.1 undecaprenyl-diphosphate phosphatase [Facklamia lactis]MBG9985982.1 undecaprenyl-diphosphate phosphatase [Facklamia lactis]